MIKSHDGVPPRGVGHALHNGCLHLETSSRPSPDAPKKAWGLFFRAYPCPEAGPSETRRLGFSWQRHPREGTCAGHVACDPKQRAHFLKLSGGPSLRFVPTTDMAPAMVSTRLHRRKFGYCGFRNRSMQILEDGVSTSEKGGFGLFSRVVI